MSAEGEVSDAFRVLNSAAIAAEPIGLDEVMSEAALQTRVDRKYLLTPDEFTLLMDGLGTGFRILDIKGRRMFNYESVYFDTPGFEQYRAHRQGRRRRYKIRVRTYVDSGLCMLEAKLKGLRGATVKHRMPYEVDSCRELTPEAREFLGGVLEENYSMELPALEPVLISDYVRGTFVSPADEERLTCDVDLGYAGNGESRSGGGLMVIETKTVDGRGVVDGVLAGLGIREEAMSKYCLGVAMLNPHLAANKWSRLLRNRFGWERRKPEPARCVPAGRDAPRGKR